VPPDFLECAEMSEDKGYQRWGRASRRRDGKGRVKLVRVADGPQRGGVSRDGLGRATHFPTSPFWGRRGGGCQGGGKAGRALPGVEGG